MKKANIAVLVSGGGTNLQALLDGAGTGHGQGEEALTEGIDPDFGIQQALGVQGEDVAVAAAGTGDENHKDRQKDHQDVQRGDHDLAGTLNAAGNAEDHNGKGSRHGNDDPEIVSTAGGKGHFDGFAQRGGFRRYRAKGAADDVHILSHGDQLAGKRHFGVIRDPAHNDGVTNAVAPGRKDRPAAD